MSSQLLFTASSQKQFGDFGEGLEGDPDTANMGIENPNNYKNDLRNTIRIPKHSEISVVNCEINRDMTFSLDLKDNFYWYYGELLDSLNENQVGSLPFIISMAEALDESEDGDADLDGLDVTDLPADRYAEVIQEAMRSSICMPPFYRTATCSVDSSSDGRKLKFTVESHGNQAGTNQPLLITDYTASVPVQSWVGLYQQNTAGVSWDFDWTASTVTLAGDTITREKATSVFTGAVNGWGVEKLIGDWDDNARVICRTAPISTVGGIWITDFSDCAGGFEIGLTRPQTHATYRYGEEITRFDGSMGGSGYPTNQCDYVVKFWDEGLTGGALKIDFIQLMRDVAPGDLDMDAPEGSSLSIMVEYFGTTTGGRPATQIDATNMFAAGKKYNFLKWEIKGEAMEVTIMSKADGSGDNQIIVTSFTTTGDATQHPLPVGMNTWAMYPLLSIPTKDEFITTTQFSNDSPNGLNWINNTGTTYNYPLDRLDRCNTYDITGWDDTDHPSGRPWVSGSSFWGGAVAESDARYGEDWGTTGLIGWMFEFLKCRNNHFNGMNGVAATYPNRYKLLDTGTEAPELCHAIVTEKGDWGSQFFDTDGIYSTHPDEPPNMARHLGILYRNLFQTVDGVTSNIAGTKTSIDYRAKWVVTASDDFGDEPDIMLIEVLPFNHQSYNLCRSVPSKMVYVVPKSDYRGRIDGKMFHESHDRYYVSLNNPADLYLNQIEVRFTDKNGVTTQDLVGCSVVTFHIQPERGRVIEDTPTSL